MRLKILTLVRGHVVLVTLIRSTRRDEQGGTHVERRACSVRLSIVEICKLKALRNHSITLLEL